MEIKSALRMLRSNPGFTVLAVAILALGIGANTAIFSVVNSVLLQPLAYREPDRIVMVGNLYSNDPKATMSTVSEPDFDDLRQQSTAFSGLAAYMGGGEGSSVMVGNSAEFAGVTRVTEDFFPVMGVDAVRGRQFTAEDHAQGANQVAVIGDSFWRRRFGGDPLAIGSTLRAFGEPFTVIGILPPGFAFPAKTDIWVARALEKQNEHRSANNWRLIGRLKTGASVPRAQSEVEAIGARLEKAYPLTNKGRSFQVRAVREQMVRNVSQTLWLLLGAVALVLLIACANVANLLLARATSRQREIAVRAALGAGRWRIARQLLTESAVLAVLAGGAGLILASWGVDALIRLAPPNLPRLSEVRVDGWVLAFTLGVSLAASMVFGLVPAIQAGRVDLNDALKQGGARSGIGGTAGRLRGALVVAEIAISMVLLVGAGLLIRSFDKLSNVQLGYRPDRLLVMNTNLPGKDLADARRSNAVYGEVAQRLSQLPGVVSASAAMGLAGAPPRSNGGYYLEGGPTWEQMGTQSPQADFLVIAPDYFKTIGVPFRRGRDFSERDGYDREFTVIVNESLVKQSFPGQDPIGRRVQCGMDTEKLMTIVGVVADFHTADPALPPRPALYMPYLQHPFYATRMTFVARTTAANPMSVAEAARQAVSQVSRDLPVQFTTMDTRLYDTVASPRFRGVLLGFFAALAVLLAMAGIYGVMAYMVTQRAGEIGLRMALGADRGKIVRLVLANGLPLMIVGLAIGTAGAWVATRLLETMLFEVERTDPLIYAAMAAAVATVTMLACAVPAWRATRVDPLVALRQE